MQLLVLQNGVMRAATVQPLRDGAIGNAQTVSVMLPIIREDVAIDLELRKFAQSLIAGCPRDYDCRVGKIFDYAKSIRYVNDPIDVERIADAATTIQEGWGDCGDKTILMASLLGSIGILSRLVKVNFYNDLAEHGYDHLYLEAQRPDGRWEAFDPTPENAPPGWEAAAAVRDVEEIWPARGVGVGGLFDGLLNLGGQLLGSAVHQGQANSAQQDAIGRQYDQLAHQLQQALLALNPLPTLTPAQITAAAQGFQQVEAYANQYGSQVSYVASQWGRDGPTFRTWLQTLAAKVPAPASGTAVSPAQTAGPAQSIAGSIDTVLPGAGSVLTSPYVWIILVVGLLWWAKS